MLCFFSSSFILSIMVAFVFGWDLTLVVLSIVPVMVFFGGMAAKVQTSVAEKEIEAYNKAGALAEEALTLVRTVVAFGGQSKEVGRYEQMIKGARSKGILRSVLTGLSTGLAFGTAFAMYGLGFWYGVKCVMDDREGENCQKCAEFFNSTGKSNSSAELFECYTDCQSYTPGALVTVLLSVIIGSIQVGLCVPYVEALNISRCVATKVFSIIGRVPMIDSKSNKGKRLSQVTGDITFKNIFFSYPNRKEVSVLKGFSLDVPTGATVALVGISGCGKSTCLQLLQRFYDPDQGQVLLDGVDIRDLNVNCLRDRIGVVGKSFHF